MELLYYNKYLDRILAKGDGAQLLEASAYVLQFLQKSIKFTF
jgi:hypothetical protein